MADKPDDLAPLSICPELARPVTIRPEITEPAMDCSETLQRIRIRTPARLLAGRAGGCAFACASASGGEGWRAGSAILTPWLHGGRGRA